MHAKPKQTWVLCGLVAASLMMIVPTFAAPAPLGPNDARGKVTAAGNNSITVKPRKGDEKTYTVSATTTITVNKKAATLADVLVGQNATITSTDGAAAATIDARTPRPRPAAPAPAPAPATPPAPPAPPAPGQ